MTMGLFGGMFGINGDGKFSCAERVVSYAVVHTPVKRGGRRALGAQFFANKPCGATWAGKTHREEADDIFVEVERSVNLIIAGLNEDELRSMDAYDRREALEDAGLDPDVYGYLDI